jgi:hypothetical protein
MEVPMEPEQPKSWLFVEELKSPRIKSISWGRNRSTAKEADLSGGVALEFSYPDKDGMLDTARADFQAFLLAAGISESGGFKIIVEKRNIGKPFESYQIFTKSDSCVISADDTEGVRRALYFVQDEIRRSDGPFLPLGTTAREPMIRTRLSRCFFGPIKRPPLNRDELTDDVDYYPDEYLNRLASEGVNGLWLTVEFRDLCPSVLFPGYGQDSARRLEKLRATALKCARYGIRIFLFCIEPRGIQENVDDPTGLEAHPGFKGGTVKRWGSYFCPSTETAKSYLEDSVFDIFNRVPELGGVIDINLGERPTHCYSATSTFFDCTCPRCSKRHPWEVFADVTSAISKGMCRANPRAEMISWLYTPRIVEDRGKSVEDYFQVMRDIAAHVPEHVTLQVNFESNGKVMQLGREKVALDYWLAWPGPSEIFADCARAAVKSGSRMSAKIQVGCSHEVATVPYVPVPGNLYRKYRAMRDLGVSSVMQCWYFGNYPGLMNKAAGELSFFPFPENEDEFLLSLAKLDWGKNAPQVSRAWSFFQKSYSEFPVNLPFTWYGPLHHSVVWPLHLIPVDQPMSPSWKFTFPQICGDRVGECVSFGHTLDEILVLLRRMDEFWSAGLKVMAEVEDDYRNNPDRLLDLGLNQALGIQINSALNVFTFYDLREKLPYLPKEAGIAALDRMQVLAGREIDNSLHLSCLCEGDSRLGFHSEAEGYKYFAEKLVWRADLLGDLIRTDFPKVRAMIETGEPIFSNYTGSKPEGNVCLCRESKSDPLPISDWGCFHVWRDEKNVFFSVRLDRERSGFEMVELDIEPRRLWPTLSYQIFSKGELWHIPKGGAETDPRWTAKISGDEREKTVDFKVPLVCFRPNEDLSTPVRFNLTIKMPDAAEASWVKKNPLEERLIFNTENPADLGWLFFQ